MVYFNTQINNRTGDFPINIANLEINIIKLKMSCANCLHFFNFYTLHLCPFSCTDITHHGHSRVNQMIFIVIIQNPTNDLLVCNVKLSTISRNLLKFLY